MKTAAALLLLFAIPSICAGDEEPKYQGKSLSEWREMTQPGFPVAERRTAIGALRGIAIQRDRFAGRAGRAEAVQWLADEIVPTLVKSLKDPEPTVRSNAANAMGWFDKRASKGAIPNLIDLLSDPSDRARAAAAAALAFRGADAEPAFPALTKTIQQDTSAEVRRDAATALRTSGPLGTEALIRLFDDNRLEARIAAIAPFAFTYPTAGSSATPASVVPKFKVLLDDDSPEMRLGAARGLVGMVHVLQANTVATLLEHRDVTVRQTVAEMLLERNEAKSFHAELFKFMEDDKAFCRAHASLLSRAGPETVPILLKLLDDQEPRVRGDAAESLGQFGPAAKEAVPKLKDLLADKAEIPLSDSGERVCHRAGFALSQITGDQDFRKGLPPLRPDGK